MTRLITAGINHRRVAVWACSECGSFRVQWAIWMPANSIDQDEPTDDPPLSDTFCPRCGKHETGIECFQRGSDGAWTSETDITPRPTLRDVVRACTWFTRQAARRRAQRQDDRRQAQRTG